MKKILDVLAPLALAAWVGALWGVGYLAVPVLFQTLPDKMLAGGLAGRMFTLVAVTGMICAACLLADCFAEHGRAALRRMDCRLVIVMLALTLVIRFGIQPVMADLKSQAFPADIMNTPLAARFGMLHGISSVCYLAQSLLGAVLVVRRGRRGRTNGSSFSA